MITLNLVAHSIQFATKSLLFGKNRSYAEKGIPVFETLRTYQQFDNQTLN